MRAEVLQLINASHHTHTCHQPLTTHNTRHNHHHLVQHFIYHRHRHLHTQQQHRMHMHQQYCHLTSFLEPLVCFQSLFSLPILHQDGPFSSFLEAPVYLQPITFLAATHTGLVTVEVSTPD